MCQSKVKKIDTTVTPVAKILNPSFVQAAIGASTVEEHIGRPDRRDSVAEVPDATGMRCNV